MSTKIEPYVHRDNIVLIGLCKIQLLSLAATTATTITAWKITTSAMGIIQRVRWVYHHNGLTGIVKWRIIMLKNLETKILFWAIELRVAFQDFIGQMWESSNHDQYHGVCSKLTPCQRYMVDWAELIIDVLDMLEIRINKETATNSLWRTKIRHTKIECEDFCKFVKIMCSLSIRFSNICLTSHSFSFFMWWLTRLINIFFLV